MKCFTGYEYLLIDVANQAGHDKLRFEDRIQWTNDNMHTLEAHAATVKAKDRPMFIKSLMALRDAQNGIPSGHLVGFDGVCSGIQMMSVLTGCIKGAEATGLVDPDRRADAYTQCTNEMQHILGAATGVSREDAKRCLMTSFYGSRKVPQEVFGEDTPELNAFYQAANTIAPGAWDLLQILLASWNSYATVHSWKMPDGYDAVVKVEVDKSARIEVDELNHSTFTYEYSVNEGTKKGLSNAANVVHSVDAYVLRNIHRRCNYDREMVLAAHDVMLNEMIDRHLTKSSGADGDYKDGSCDPKLAYYIDQYNRSTMADPVILPYIDHCAMEYMEDAHVDQLIAITESMLQYEPFEVVTIHDEFRCHPNNMNHLRQQYINILAELAESEVLSDLLSQLYGQPYQYNKLSNDLPDLIRKSNYALC